jgi:hypothetical protein
MKSTSTLLLGAALTVVLPSCETTDDPRAGGLIGYLATGDEGYQRRITDRQNHLGYLDNANAQEAARANQLQDRRSTLMANKSKLSSLRQEAIQMNGGIGLAGQIHAAEQNAGDDAPTAARVRELERQVEALRRRQ